MRLHIFTKSEVGSLKLILTSDTRFCVELRVKGLGYGFLGFY